MKRTIAALLYALALAGTTAHAGLIVTLAEAENGGVDLSLQASGEYDGSLNLTHLGYFFFDDLGNPFKDGVGHVNGDTSGGLQPLNAGFLQVADGIQIQAIVLDDESNKGPATDDFALRFFGEGGGFSNGDALPGPFDLTGDSRTSRLSFLTFDELNPGTYFSNTNVANAFGGFELRVVAMPEPTTLWAMLIGGVAIGVARRPRRC